MGNYLNFDPFSYSDVQHSSKGASTYFISSDFLYQTHLPGCDADSCCRALEAIWEAVDTEFSI